MKYDVTYAQQRCSGCLRCQLACSCAHVKGFQPSEAHIQIETWGLEYRAVFGADCVHCGLCADDCLFGALKKHPRSQTAARRGGQGPAAGRRKRNGAAPIARYEAE
jgi:formate hydrogenlyase subunit 6/NADH:ubiquinone oxidoreductase subunit I